ncbi:putative integral membrane protein (apicoplast) [Theileria parva strain Muguga]|uniref:Uncharacterized protein n=1 Tax=Theileria parva TaxID=5875 RepID=Q4MY85_THEPA|nr:putative integral membrane protein [Theileria parva strain Muguga]|eukprot:XP_762707.1 hypothetical protein (apicoplast) [Theileria parva strain Muguga]
MDLKIIRSYVEIHYKILLKTYSVKHNILRKIWRKLYNFIKDIINKVNANNYILLANIEYLNNKNMFIDFIYALIYNRKEVFNVIIAVIKIFINFSSELITYYYIYFLKILLSFMVEYVKKNDGFCYLTIKEILKLIIRFIKGLLYLGKMISGIFLVLCFCRRI